MIQSELQAESRNEAACDPYIDPTNIASGRSERAMRRPRTFAGPPRLETLAQAEAQNWRRIDTRRRIDTLGDWVPEIAAVLEGCSPYCCWVICAICSRPAAGLSARADLSLLWVAARGDSGPKSTFPWPGSASPSLSVTAQNNESLATQYRRSTAVFTVNSRRANAFDQHMLLYIIKSTRIYKIDERFAIW